MVTVETLLNGYGPKFKEKFPTLDSLMAVKATSVQEARLRAPLPAMGRYFRSVAFLQNVTSGERLGMERFRVIKEYFIALAERLTDYDGMHKDHKVVCDLTEDQEGQIRDLAMTTDDIIRAEALEEFSDHDTAAAGDLVKILIGSKIPELESKIEGVHFAATSEDVMGNVFGVIGNELVYGYFVPLILDFCEHLMNYADTFEKTAKRLSIPGYTHDQAAEPHTLSKKFATRVRAIEFQLQSLIKNDGFQPFSGKMGGAIGNLTTHYAAYPDIDWFEFSKKFVEGFGLHYESMTDQSTSYTVEAQIFSAMANIMTQMHKVTEDFVDLTSCPAQLFVKEKKPGQKGSSIMPNKSNAWGMEGAEFMFRFARTKMTFYAQDLPGYPHEGNMERSYALRNLGDVFMEGFIGMKRVMREMNNYVANLGKIEAFFHEYPGMSGSSIQTVLKREGIEGDAYREIQSISINSDGTYANEKEFGKRLDEKLQTLGISPEAHFNVLNLLHPDELVRPSHEKTHSEIEGMKRRFQDYRAMLTQYAPKETING